MTDDIKKVVNVVVEARNIIIRTLYIYILKPIFFAFDPEDVHDQMTAFGKILGNFVPVRFLTQVFFDFQDARLSQNVLGINFKNPIGLAAGFDKNAELLDILPSVGFGFAEIGSVTGYMCKGNPKPRLWRLPKSSGLVVYYGLKNNGSEEISSRLKNRKFSIPVGASIAMTNSSLNLSTQVAVKDYAKSFEIFTEIGDYITVNISCPNAEGGQPFIEPDKLDLLFDRLDTVETNKPIFIKLSPDISFAEVDAILEIIKKHRIHGVICTNLTKKRDNPLISDKNIPNVGGISGKPVQGMADDLLSYIYKKEVLNSQNTENRQGKRLVLVGCGGVFNAEDAYKKIRSGATLVQLITGMIFEGPQAISEINRGLVGLLERDGFLNISEAIGADYK